MTMMKIKTIAAGLDCTNTAIALQDSFVAEADEFSDENYNDMIDNWICIEDEDEIVNAICEDEMEELESNAKPVDDDDAEDDDEPNPQPTEVDDDESNFVSYTEAVEVLGKLQRSAPKLGVNEAATVHLDRFLKALHAGNAKKARRDTTLHAYFAKK
jgi:hypothetical protein